MLRKEGDSVQTATKKLEGQSVAFKNELLFSRGINFDTLPSWQKRGIGVYWGQVEKEGYNPITKQKETASRRELIVDDELPLREAYSSYIARFLTEEDR